MKSLPSLALLLGLVVAAPALSVGAAQAATHRGQIPERHESLCPLNGYAQSGPAAPCGTQQAAMSNMKQEPGISSQTDHAGARRALGARG